MDNEAKLNRELSKLDRALTAALCKLACAETTLASNDLVTVHARQDVIKAEKALADFEDRYDT